MHEALFARLGLESPSARWGFRFVGKGVILILVLVKIPQEFTRPAGVLGDYYAVLYRSCNPIVKPGMEEEPQAYLLVPVDRGC